MPVKETSIEAYLEHIGSGKALKQRESVFVAIHEQTNNGVAVNRNQLCKLTGLRINVICGRVNELMNMKLVTSPYKSVDPDGPAVTPVEYLETVPITQAAPPTDADSAETTPVQGILL